jgi:ABC-2 type transport system permease protein
VFPLVISVFMLMPAIRSPEAPAVVWMSMVPFFAPVVMFTRIVIQMPPVWEIVLSLFLLILTTGALLVLGARIYRVGILMYGKRLTIPEVLHWMRRSRV